MRIVHLLIALALVLPCKSICGAEIRYQITDLGFLYSYGSAAYGINDFGQIVGTSNSLPVIWHDGKISALPIFTRGYGWANGINNKGQIAGLLEMDNGDLHAVLWDNDTPVDLGTVASRQHSEAFAVNDSGMVVGNAMDRGFVWKDGVMTAINPPFEWLNSSTWDVNNLGQAVGYYQTDHGGRAYIWQDGVIQELPPLPGDTRSGASRINNLGQVLGASYGPMGLRPVMWDHGVPIELNVGLTDINDHGLGVGRTGNNLYLWDNGTVTYLSDITDGYSEWTNLRAYEINNSGWVVGTGTHSGYTRGFLLTPVPEPPSLLTLALAASGLGVGMVRRRRK